MNSSATEIEKLHAWYCQTTGLRYPLNAALQRGWTDLLREFSAEDVQLVTRYLLRGVRCAERNFGCLKLNHANFFAPDKFLDDLVLAQKVFRVRETPRPVARTILVAPGETVTRLDAETPDATTTVREEGIKMLRECADKIARRDGEKLSDCGRKP